MKTTKLNTGFELPMNSYEIFRIITIVIIIICVLLIIFKKEVKKYFSEGFANQTKTNKKQTDENMADTETPATPAKLSDLLSLSNNPFIRKPDFKNLSYPFRVGGYVPTLDIIVTRFLMWRIWVADISDSSQTTAISESPNPSQTFYNKQYETFEDFFTAELKNIPRLNIFIPKEEQQTTLTMNIILTRFKKPDWVIQMAKYYKTPTIDGKTATDYVNTIQAMSPEDREGNTTNTFNDNNLANLSLITVPIILREKLEKAGQGSLVINLKTANSDAKTNFNEQTLGFIKFITDHYPTLNMLYVSTDNEITQELLGLGKNQIFTNDDLIKPTIVQEARTSDSWSLAKTVGYTNNQGITYQLNLLTDQNEINQLLELHTNSIRETAKRAFLQNSFINEYIRNEYIKDVLTSITDNIYYYYFNIGNMPNRGIIPISGGQQKNRVFQKIDKHKIAIFQDLPNFFNLESIKKDALNNLPTDADPKIKLQLQSELKYIQTTISKLDSTMPYIIYLPIYDFQYIKIIPRRNLSDIYTPEISKNIRI